MDEEKLASFELGNSWDDILCIWFDGVILGQ